MSQYHHLFQSTRIPQLDGFDTLERYEDSNHILVIVNGNFYIFDVYDENKRLFAPEYYFLCFQEIFWCEISNPEKRNEVGVLTHGDRDTWAKMRHHLDVELGNRKKLKKIDSAIFTICLDDWTHDDKDADVATKHMIVGPDPANRWADKSIRYFAKLNLCFESFLEFFTIK